MQSIKDFADVTTLHGIKDLFSVQSRPLRVFWACILMLTCVILIYEIVQIIQTFASEPIATNVRLQKMARRDLLEVIAPSICIADWMSKSSAQTLGYSREQLVALDTFSNQITAQMVHNKAKYALKNNLNETGNATDELDFQEVSRFIREYQMQMLREGITLEYLYTPLIKRFDFVRKIARFAPYMILTDSVCFPIELDPATDVVGVPVYRQELDMLRNDTVDFLAAIHSQKQEITLVFYEGPNMRYVSEIDRIPVNYTIDAEPSQLNVRMRFQKITTLNRHDTPCRQYPKHEAAAKYPVNYARQLFMQKCLDDLVYRKPPFNCSFLIPRMDFHKQLALTQQSTGYVLCTADKFYQGLNAQAMMRQCQDQSEDKISFCVEWAINNERMRWVSPRTCRTPGCLNLAIVAQPTLEVSEEVLLMTFDTLLSNLGGQAGLWFGASILSIAQLIFVFCLHGMARKCAHCKRTLVRRQDRSATTTIKQSETAETMDEMLGRGS